METISGYIDHIVYHNNENGYSVLNFIADQEEVICVGSLQGLDNGESLSLTGEYVEHPVYGKQFKIHDYKVVAPGDELSMERYLSSGAIKGIGETIAKRIVRTFGKDTFRIMEEEPERLIEIKGISERIAREIASQVIEKKDMREAFVFLQKYGISNTLAVKIYEKYGMSLYGIMKENPYQLAEDIQGIGFRIADDIASKIGIHTDSDYRIRSGIFYTMLQATQEGHAYLPQNLLLHKASELLEVAEEAIEPQIGNLAIDHKLVLKKKDDLCKIYSTSSYYTELACAVRLHDLNVVFQELLPCEEDRVHNILVKMLGEEGLCLDNLQKEAVLQSIQHGVMILSGGPGTGKTTTINTIIKYFARERMDILLAAPTGRAAKRMTETTGYEAKTIHRLLEINGSMEDGKKAHFERNEDNPLEADVIIIDEMSMVDMYLFQALLNAVSIGTRLILVGDVDQLPSVGPGQVLRDVIDSQAFPVVMLQKVFRQSEESDIVVNAHKINRGENISLDNKSKDFFFLERKDPQVIYKHMIQLILDKLPSYVEATPLDIQVITPMRKGVLGVETLNEILQKYLNPEDSSKKEYCAGERTFREGDKVMQIRNNYQLPWQIVSKYGIAIDSGTGVFNGDTGVIRRIQETAQTITIEYDEHRQVDYTYSQMEEVELAYAVTVHKSQGSEYPAVILPLLSGPRMLLNRNLLYTAVTRARKCVTILGSSNTFFEMIQNDKHYERYTSLCERIQDVAGKEMDW